MKTAIMRYKSNIKLDYYYTFMRNVNVTHGIWLIYLNIEKGFSLLEIGLFEAIFHIASLTMEVPTGMVGDLIGRKFSRALGIISLIAYTAIVLLGTDFYLIAIGFFICGLGYTFESGSGDALVYDTLIELNQSDKFMKVQGNKEILFQLGSSIGLLVGGYIAIRSFELNYIIMLFILTTALIPILIMTEIPLKTREVVGKFSQKVYEHFVKSTKTVFSNVQLRNLILIGALMAAPITSLFFYLQNHLESLEYTTFTIGLILALHSIAGAVGGFLAHIIERKFKEVLILYIVPILIVISLWLVLIDAIVFIPFILLGFLDSIFYVVLSDYSNRLIQSDQRATVISFGSLAFSIVMILLFPLIGFLGDKFSLKVGFSTLAMIVTVSYILLLISLKKSHTGNVFS